MLADTGVLRMQIVDRRVFAPDVEDRAYLVANRLAGTLLLTLGVLALAAGLLAPELVDALADDFREIPEKFDLTVLFSRGFGFLAHGAHSIDVIAGVLSPVARQG